MPLTQEKFNKLTVGDLEKMKFTLDANGDVCVRVILEGDISNETVNINNIAASDIISEAEWNNGGVYLIDNTSQDVTITLPNPALVEGKVRTFKALNGAFSAKIASTSNIDGSGVYEFSNMESVGVISDGTTYFLIN